MHILILGAGGFIGWRLAGELKKKGSLTEGPIAKLTLVDLAFPVPDPGDQRIQLVPADYSNRESMREILQQKPDIIFHLAAVVSGEAEKSLDLGMKMNFHATLQLLELCRAMDIHPRIVFASSCAVFGGEVSTVITDDTTPNPRSSYGTQKAMAELLMNDYSRRGFVDARSLRLPTIAVRSGKPNAAASSFVSAIIRDPLEGKRVNCPVPPETELWIQSPGCVVRNLIHAATLEEGMIKDNRIINLPALTVTVRDMIDSLEASAPPGITDRITFESDEFISGIVLTWPAHFQTRRADRLGFKGDGSANEIVSSYMDDQGIPAGKF